MFLSYFHISKHIVFYWALSWMGCDFLYFIFSDSSVLHLYSNANSIIAKAISISNSDIQNSDISAKDTIKLRQTPIKMDYDELYNNSNLEEE